MDNCWNYNEGRSELRMSVALEQEGYRNNVFLMTKIDGRTKKEAAQQIDTSMKRMRTDHIDLVQHHEILRFDDPDRVFAEGGAMEAFTEARAAGKLRYIGFTGHKGPRIHLQMLSIAEERGFHFDSVQMPLNVMDAHFRSFAHLVLPTTVVITGMESQRDLDQAFEAVHSFKPMAKPQVAELLSRSKPYAMEGKYELFKTSSTFDGTAKNNKWLGEDVEGVKKLAPTME